MRTTSNFGLLKPDRPDKYDPEIFNRNLEKIDEHFGLYGVNMGRAYDTDRPQVIAPSAGSGATITTVVASRYQRTGYLRIVFQYNTKIELTAAGRIIGGAKKIGILTPRYSPLMGVQLMSGTSEWGCQGYVDPHTNQVWLNSVHTQSGVTEIAAGTSFELVSVPFLLKGDL